MYRQEPLRKTPQNPAGRAAIEPGKVVMNLTWSLKLFSDPYSFSLPPILFSWTAFEDSAATSSSSTIFLPSND